MFQERSENRLESASRCIRTIARCYLFIFLSLAVAVHPQPGDEIFSNGFESSVLCSWNAVIPGPLITSTTPSEGSFGTRITVLGLEHTDPRFFLSPVSGTGIDLPLDLVEVQAGRFVVEIVSGVPAGSYYIKVEPCPSQTTVISPHLFEVRAPSELDLTPRFAAPGTQVTLTGTFLGTQTGSITIRPQGEPTSAERQVSILSWTDDDMPAPGNVVFVLPPDLATNGHYDVRVENSAATVTEPAALVAIGIDDDDDEDPRIVSAVATSNTEVLMQFSEPVRGEEFGAENPAHYQIVSPTTRLATLSVLRAEVEGPTLRLTTTSQADLLYQLTMTNVWDLAGNPIAPPSTVEFYGISPTGGENVDSDGDGLTDSDEQRGWHIEIHLAGGEVESRHVSSDPGNPLLDVGDPVNLAARDTDGDGVFDNEEKHGGMDPRSPDTDGDTLTDYQEWKTILSDPTHQDTDEDGIQDGAEYLTFLTSPILDDTDGDQILDPDEIYSGNRNPLAADLPGPNIHVENINLQLDTRFTYTDESGEVKSVEEQNGTTLARSENDTFGTSNERATKQTLEFSETLEGEYSWATPPGAKIKAGFGSKQGSEESSTFRVDETSGRTSEEAYHESLTTSASFDVRESVTREVFGAAIKASVTIESTSDIPFTISHLELSAQAQDPADRRRLIPIASLVPEVEILEPGFEEIINIGALGDPARGPFVFETTSVFPRQVEELLKNPRGLIVELANFDITDELGRNFAFVSQEVLDKTAGINFDLGDGRIENYRVATASTHDAATGQPLGITVRYALQTILGLYGTATIRDGSNGRVDTAATGNDVQKAPVGSAVQPGQVIITAGPDGVLDTAELAGDDRRVEADYESQPSRAIAILDGGNGVADTEAMDDDVQEVIQGDPVTRGGVVISAGANGVLDTTEISDDDVRAPEGSGTLTRFRDVETGLGDDPDTSLDETRLFWTLYSSKDLSPGVALDDIVLHAGDALSFTYVQDQDADGVWAREEHLHGSSDHDPNSDGCDGCDDGPVAARDGAATFDTLTDGEEIQDGWRVQIKGELQSSLVYPNPVQGDSDRDWLADHEEKACATDPRQRDTDLDGLTDWEELTGHLIIEGSAVLMVSVDPVTSEEVTITTYKGDDTGHVYHESLDACDEILGFDGFATDPSNPDTDGDMVPDGVELQLGIHPNNPFDGPNFLDDDGDGVSNSEEERGYEVGVNCGSTPSADCVKKFTSDPDDPDTDGDGLPDLLEHFLGSNPRSIDTDEDGLKDIDEYKGGGDACVTVVRGEACQLFKNLSQDDFATFIKRCGDADVCLYDESQLLDGRPQYGTNLNERDTDLDAVDDPDELGELPITVNGLPLTLAAPFSDPLKADTDDDGLADGEEVTAGTDPRKQDTDEDMRTDFAEVNTIMTDPTFKDRRIKVSSDGFDVTLSDDEGPDNDADMVWGAEVQNDGGGFEFVCATEETVPVGFLSFDCTYFEGILRDGVDLDIRMTAVENDSNSPNEECTSVTETFSFSDLGDRTVMHTCDTDLAFTTELKVIEE